MPKYKFSIDKTLATSKVKYLDEMFAFTLNALKKHRWPIALLVLWALTSAGLQGWLGIYLFSDNKGSWSRVLTLFVGVAFLRILMGWYSDRVSNAIFAGEKVNFFTKVQDYLSSNPRLSKDEILYIFSSDLANLVNSIGTTVVNFLSASLTFLTLFLVVVAYFPKQVAPILSIGFILAVLSVLLKVKMRRFFEFSRKEDSKLFKSEKSLIEGFEYLKVSGLLKDSSAAYEKGYQKWERFSSKGSLANSSGETLMWSAKYLFILLLLLPTGWVAISMDTVYWAFLLLGSGSQILGTIQRLGISQALWVKCRSILLARPTVDQRKESPNGQLSVSNLSIGFGNLSTTPEVKGLTFAIGPSQCLLIKGVSGSGKTTLLRALLGLHKNYAGNISFPLSSRVSYVGQTPFFEDGLPISQNLRIKKLNSDHQEMVEGLSLRQFFDQFGDSLESRSWGESDIKPSRGQVQRLAILRELARDPHVLVLDEPSTGLDKKTEAQVFEFLNQWRQNKILIVAEHGSLAEKYLSPDKVINIEDYTKEKDIEEIRSTQELGSELHSW